MSGSGLDSPAADSVPPAPANQQQGPSDAGAATLDVVRGSPLCRVMPDNCVPDDDGLHHADGAVTCASPDPSTADASTATRSCRIKRSTIAPGTLSPSCDDCTTGRDGALCGKAADCAAGFDCVSGQKGSTCRRYCCLGSCETQTSQNGGATFCDVQQLADLSAPAPVCMPLKHCMLLGTGECATSETCAVVDQNGSSGCVEVGDALVEASCEELHCAAGLTCLGQAGNRKCYELCKVGSSSCGAKTCKTSSLFKDSSFGVCQ